MKGLLIKDFYFAKQQKKMVMILAVIFASFIFFQGTESAAFVISYFTLVGGLMTITSISYDDHDGSIAFVMTWPITRKQYVLEKYIFGFLCGGLCWALASSIYIILDFVDALETLAAAGVLLLVLTFFLMIMIPIQLKFGGDKGRIALIGIVAACLSIVYGAKMIGEKFYQVDFDRILDLLNEKLAVISPWMIAGTLLIVWCIALTVSVMISIRIMEKKEY